MRIQLWSYNYSPEPTGIAPVSRTLAEGLAGRGHRVEVIAAHPHYPEPAWGRRLMPYREHRDGIPVLRLPLWIGRQTGLQRMRQEVSFMLAQSAAAPFLGTPDVLISASPCFPALLPAALASRARRMPWLLWLHDILPDGATATGLLNGGPVLAASRWLERRAYADADSIVVLSSAFTRNLVAKGVPTAKVRLIYDPATLEPRTPPAPERRPGRPLRALSMGNIGFSQGLTPLLAAFERSVARDPADVEITITGGGVAAPEAAAEVRSARIRMLGLVSEDELERQLQNADIALVTQRHAGSEFNIPSKLMNYLIYGLPVLAAVNPGGEVAHIVRESGAGWVVDSSDPDAFPAALTEIARSSEDVVAKRRAALEFGRRHFDTAQFVVAFEDELRRLVDQRILG